MQRNITRAGLRLRMNRKVDRFVDSQLASPAPVRNTVASIPTIEELTRLPIAESGTYLLTAAQVSAVRSRIYRLNTDNAYGWRWRSAKMPASSGMFMLVVWRIS